MRPAPRGEPRGPNREAIRSVPRDGPPAHPSNVFYDDKESSRNADVGAAASKHSLDRCRTRGSTRQPALPGKCGIDDRIQPVEFRNPTKRAPKAPRICHHKGGVTRSPRRNTDGKTSVCYPLERCHDVHDARSAAVATI